MREGLVTGHHGYIGSVRPGTARARSTMSPGSTPSSTEGATSGRRRSRALPCARRSRRDGRRSSRGSMRSSTWRRCRTTRWRLRAPSSRTTSTWGNARDRASGHARPVFGDSSSRLRARCTARRADVLLDEDRPAEAADAVRRVEGACRGGVWRSSPPPTSSSSRCETPRCTVSSPRLRLDIVLNNLAGWAHATGQIRLLSDGLVVAPDAPCPRSHRVAGELLGAPRRSIRVRPSTSDPRPRTTRFASSPNVLAEVTGCETSMASEATNDPRSYRVDFSKLAAPALSSGSAGTPGAGRRS